MAACSLGALASVSLWLRNRHAAGCPLIALTLAGGYRAPARDDRSIALTFLLSLSLGVRV